MSKDSGNDPQVVQNQTNIPAFLQSAYQTNIDKAKLLMNRPYQAGPETLAGLNPAVQNAWNYGASTVGQWQPTMDAAQTIVGASAQPFQSVSPQSFLSGFGNIGSYMNPYTQNVEDAALSRMGDAFKQSLIGIGDKAQGAGAYGGSRMGVAEGTAANEFAKSFGDLSAQLRNQNWNQAVQTMGQDIGNDLQAQMSNQSALPNWMRAMQSGGLTLGQLGGQVQGLLGGDANMLSTIGGQMQSWDQAQTDDQRAAWERQWGYPISNLNLGLAAASATPLPNNTTTTTTGGGSSNSAMNVLGGAATGAKLGATLGTAIPGIGNAVGAVGGGLLGGLLGFSDREMKTDIERTGTDKATGLPVYAYRYKGDPKTYPKMAGPMAQDVEKKYPHLVHTIGGRKAVNFNGLAGFGFGAAA